MVRDYGQAELKDVERRLFEPSQSVSAWFAPEVKLGSLGGSMEAPQCFGAEIYAQVGGRAGEGGCWWAAALPGAGMGWRVRMAALGLAALPGRRRGELPGMHRRA